MTGGIVAMPCGYQSSQTMADLHALTGRPGWDALSSVRHGRVFVADGHHYFNRLGPRLVQSAEIIAACLDAVDSGAQRGEGWTRLEPISAPAAVPLNIPEKHAT